MKKSLYIKRKLEDTILKYVDSPEIIAVVGPRQSGKTTLLLKVFEKIGGSKKGHFISFEDQKILNIFEEDLDEFVELYIKGKEYLFIDEFQYAKNGGKKLKYIFDLHPIKIFISGSSVIDLTVNTLKFLVGRIFVFELYPLDFEEFLSFKDADYWRLVKKIRQKFDNRLPAPVGKSVHSRFLKYYEEFVIFGGYPRVVTAKTKDEKTEVLRNIYNTYFLREVRDVLGLVDDYKLAKLIKSLALQIGNLVEYKEISMLSEYAYPTLKKYLNFLEKTFICSFIKPYFRNKRIEIVKNPKVYFFDTGLRNFVVNDFRKFDDRPDAGAVLENAVFQQLVKNSYQPNYWRTKKQYELDFIVSLKNRQEIGIEVKNHLDKTVSPSLNYFKKLYPEIKVIFAYRKISKKLAGNNQLLYPIYAI